MRNVLRLGPKSGHEPELPPGIDTLATLLRRARLPRRAEGQVAPQQASQRPSWSAADPERIERDYGFAEWEPPDAGGDTKAEHFGGGNAGHDARRLG